MTTTRLVVGDPHVKINNLQECEKLIDFILDVAVTNQIKRVEFLGDLFHTHAVKRIEVEKFWSDTLKKFREKDILVIALCGNHDKPGSTEKEHMNALQVFKFHPGVMIIDEPTVYTNIGYTPYFSNKDDFLRAANSLYKDGATEYLVAHQTFTGSKFENGFYAPDGIDLELVPQTLVESGHIHSQQIVGKCHYPGTPKWDTMSDANQEKGIWIFTHKDDGSICDKKFITTRNVVTPINEIEFREGEEEPVLDKKARNHLILLGKSAWISKMKKKFRGMASIKAKPVDRKSRKIDKDTIFNLDAFLRDFFIPIDGISKEDINKYLNKREVA